MPKWLVVVTPITLSGDKGAKMDPSSCIARNRRQIFLGQKSERERERDIEHLSLNNEPLESTLMDVSYVPLGTMTFLVSYDSQE